MSLWFVENSHRVMVTGGGKGFNLHVSPYQGGPRAFRHRPTREDEGFSLIKALGLHSSDVGKNPASLRVRV